MSIHRTALEINGVEDVPVTVHELLLTRNRWRKKVRYIIDANGCHVCTSHASTKQGYVKITHKYRATRMHRVIYEQAHGPIPDGMLVRHSCDNRRCINIEHLLLGTNKSNSEDMVVRGRSMRGEKQHFSKLNAETVRLIREAVPGKGRLKRLAESLGINYSTIKKVRKKETWKHL